jgi:hypothetical protein
MLARMTISGEEYVVLRRAVLADLPTIDAVLAAYQDVNQRHARALHERFQRELSLLNMLGWRAGVPGRSHDLYSYDATPAHALETLFERAWVTVRDHLVVVDSRPTWLLEATGPILHQLAVAAGPRIERPPGFLHETVLSMIRYMHETVLLLPGYAEPIRDALKADVKRASAALEVDTVPSPQTDADYAAARQRVEEAQRLLADLDPASYPEAGQYKLTASHDLISRTVARLSLHACEELRAQIESEPVDRPLLAHAVDTLATTTLLFDRFVQESAGDEDGSTETDDGADAGTGGDGGAAA